MIILYLLFASTNSEVSTFHPQYLPEPLNLFFFPLLVHSSWAADPPQSKCPVKWSNWPMVTFWRTTTDYVMLCEDVFWQITLSKEEAGSYVPPWHKAISWGPCLSILFLNWDAAGPEPPLRSTNTNTHKHILFGIHALVWFILSAPAF